VTQALVVVLAYLLGSIPFAYLAGRSRGVDLRTVGSGNLGAANVFRTLGRDMGIAVMVADILKGVVAVVIARLLTDDPWPAVAAAAAMAGHVFPVWLRFKGGKGVAVGGGATLALMPLAALIVFAIWLAVAVTTRYTSLASIAGALAVTPLAWGLGYPTSTIVFAGAGAAALLFLHRGNIRRLLRGEENRIELRRARPRPAPESRPSG
jgi:acyl phosphate:glycerol-3-phosphate acyltransferase